MGELGLAAMAAGIMGGVRFAAWGVIGDNGRGVGGASVREREGGRRDRRRVTFLGGSFMAVLRKMQEHVCEKLKNRRTKLNKGINACHQHTPAGFF